MTRKALPLLAAIAFAALPAQAQTTAEMPQPEPPKAVYSDAYAPATGIPQEKMNLFAKARLDMEALQAAYDRNSSQATDPQKRMALAREFQRDKSALIADSGLTVDEYFHIENLLQRDATVQKHYAQTLTFRPPPAPGEENKTGWRQYLPSQMFTPKEPAPAAQAPQTPATSTATAPPVPPAPAEPLPPIQLQP